MKRLLAALGLVLCAVGFASVASADFSGQPRWILEDLKFINTQSPALADSFTASGSAARLDTTAAFQLMSSSFHWPSIILNPTTTTVDSAFYMQLQVSPTSDAAITVSADSIYLQTQVSMDGVNWVLCTPRTAYQVANTVNPYATGAWVVESASSNNFYVWFKQSSGVTGVSTAVGATAPTELQLFGWNFVRFIIGSANDGRWTAKVLHQTVWN